MSVEPIKTISVFHPYHFDLIVFISQESVHTCVVGEIVSCKTAVERKWKAVCASEGFSSVVGIYDSSREPLQSSYVQPQFLGRSMPNCFFPKMSAKLAGALEAGNGKGGPHRGLLYSVPSQFLNAIHMGESLGMH